MSDTSDLPWKKEQLRSTKRWFNKLIGSGDMISNSRNVSLQEKQPLPDDDAEVDLETQCQDGGYGWLIVFASFMAHVTVYGVSWSVGVFNLIFLEEFKSSKTATAWVCSLMNATMYGSGLLASFLVRRYGCRPIVLLGGLMASAGLALSGLAHELYVLYFTFSLLGGMGLGLTYIPSVVIVSEYFKKRRTIALGLAVSGVGMGGIVYPPIIWSLIEVFSWRIVMPAIGGIVFLTLTVFGAMMKPAKRNNHRNVELKSEAKQWGIFMCHPPFVALCINNFIFCFGLVVVYVHLGAFASASGLFSDRNAARIFSIIGISNLVGRVCHGFVCHFPRMTTIPVYMLSSVIAGIATAMIPFSVSATALAICAALFGFFSACLGALLPDIIIRLVGKDQLGPGYGLILLFEGAGSMIGGPIAGLLYDCALVYDTSFFMAGCLLVLSGLIMVVPWWYTRSCQPPTCRKYQSQTSDGVQQQEPDEIRCLKKPPDPEDFVLHVTSQKRGGHTIRDTFSSMNIPEGNSRVII